MKQILIFTALSIVFCSGKTQNNIVQVEKEYTIAYNVHLPDTTKDDWEIMHMQMDGSGKKNITNRSDVAWTYYAYQKRLFFISDRDTCYRCFFLYECNADGSDIRQVCDLQLEDSWMSSRNHGQEMIVSGRIGTAVRYQLFIIDTRTGTYNQITKDTAAMFMDPCFSPDGKTIVFSYKKNRRDKTSHEELYLMLPDDEMKQLTVYPEDNPSAKEYGYRAGAARWHPTENFITYLSMQDGRHSIFAITPDGKKQWKLLENADSDGWHDWSSDGRWLVYNSSDRAETQFHIMLMNWETKEKKQLTDTTFRSQLAPVFISNNE